MTDMLTSLCHSMQVLSDNPSSEAKLLHPVKRPCSQPDSGSSGDGLYSRPAKSESRSPGELAAQAEHNPSAAAGKNALLHRSSPGPSSCRHFAIPPAATLPQSGGPAYDQTRATSLTSSMHKQGSIGMQNMETKDHSSERGGGHVDKADRQADQEALVHGQQAGKHGCTASPIMRRCCRSSSLGPPNAVCGMTHEGTNGSAGFQRPGVRVSDPPAPAFG